MIDDWLKNENPSWRMFAVEGLPTLMHYLGLRKWILYARLKTDTQYRTIGELDDHGTEEDINNRVVQWAEDLLKDAGIAVPRSYEYARHGPIKDETK